MQQCGGGHVARAYVICMLIAMTLSADFQTTCLETHNKYRQEEAVKFKVANLNELKWSYFLAGRARNFALQCVFRHSDSQNHLGQNLFYAAPFNKPGTTYVTKALATWMSEREKFNRNKQFKCCGFGPGFTTTCCHYRQVVSAGSDLVGCGLVRCPKLHNADRSAVLAENAVLIFCLYSPHGNIFNRYSPTPYKYGRPCSKCDPGKKCKNSLCV